MSEMHEHIDRGTGFGFPPEVRAALAHEPAQERAALEETWALAGQALAGEPDEAAFRRLGAEIRANLEAVLRQETEPREPTVLRLVKTPLRLVTSPALRWSAVAACLALLIAVGVLLTQRPISHTAPYGEIAHLELPDGSDVVLNSGATLRYRRAFDNEARSVTLTGEAFFVVEPGTRPFTVETFNGATTVLGTQFNVRAWEDDVHPATRVDLLAGRVRFTARQTGEAVTLEAGQSALLADGTTTPLLLDEGGADYAASWRHGAFKFVNQPLGTVADEIERRYDVRIKIHPKSLRATPVALLKEKPLGVEEILRDICEYNTYEYRVIPGGYEIFQPDAE